MLENKTIALLGYSGHAFVVVDVALSLGYTVLGYFDKSPSEFNPFALNYLGVDAEITSHVARTKSYLFPAVGENKIRQKLYQYILQQKGRTLPLVSNSAICGYNVKIGNGSFVSNGVCLNALVTIGNGCIINTGAIVEHECSIADFVHIAPGAVLAGNVSIGKGSFIGANAVIKQGVKIGENVIIGAGAVVLKDIENGQICVGNPSRKISKR